MSFFKKLKDRMTRSSSKIDEGLDAIVSEGDADPHDIAPALANTQTVTAAPDSDDPDIASEPPAQAAPQRGSVVVPTATPAPSDLAADDTGPAKKPGVLGRLLGRQDATATVRRALDDTMLEQLEELLISTDMGVDTALRVTANMADGRMGKKLSAREIKQLMAAEIARIMDPVARPMPLYAKKPQVVLVWQVIDDWLSIHYKAYHKPLLWLGRNQFQHLVLLPLPYTILINNCGKSRPKSSDQYFAHLCFHLSV